MNYFNELIQKLSTSLSLVVATSATAVSYFTMNDIAVLLGIASTIILSVMNWSRHKQQKIKVRLEIEKLKLENEKLRRSFDRE